MKSRKIISVCAVVFLLVTWGMSLADEPQREIQQQTGVRETTAGPERVLVGTINSSDGVDVYKLECLVQSGKPKPRCARADVCDQGPVFDTSFQVHIVGQSGVKAGKADMQQGIVGGCATSAQLCRPDDGALSVFLLFSETNQAGAEDYDSVLDCVSSNGSIAPHKLTKVQDQ